MVRLRKLIASRLPDLPPDLEIETAPQQELAELIQQRLTQELPSDRKNRITRSLYERYLEHRGKLFEANVRLCCLLAQNFRRKAVRISFEDLLQSAYLGLLSALDRFEISNTTRVATYAGWWIVQKMQHLTVVQGMHNCLAVGRDVAVKALQLQDAKFEAKNTGARFSIQEQADRLGIITFLAERLLQAYDTPAKLSNPESPVFKSLLDESAGFEVERIDNLETVWKLLDSLPEREREFLTLKFGILTGVPMTLEEIGDQHGLSKERVRQICDLGLEQIRFNLGLNQEKETESAKV
jgi:RNA polymerase primary sigma factor